MDFGIDKCAILAMRRGYVVNSEGTQLLDGQTCKSLKGGESHKYLGVLESDTVLTIEIKTKLGRN